MTALRLAAVLLVILGFERLASAQADERAVSAVRLLLVSRGGDAVPAGRLTIRSDQGDVFYSATPKGEANVQLPYGRYRVSFSHEMMLPAERDIEVKAKQTLVVLPVDFILMHVDLPRGALAVRLRGPSCVAASPVWARLVGVFSDVSSVSEVKFGQALFEDIDPGAYVAIVVSGKAALSATPVTVAGKHTVLEVSWPGCQ